MTIPFRISDNVSIHGDTWFEGARGRVVQVYPESGTLMVELDEWGAKVPNGLVLPFAPSELSAASCQHPTVSEVMLRAYIDRRWSDVELPYCLDCNEWLYPEEDDNGGIHIYVGEPRGSGRPTDPW